MCLCDFFCYLIGGICDYVWICCLMGRGLSEIFWKEISVNYVNVLNDIEMLNYIIKIYV